VCNMLQLILVFAELEKEWATLQGRTTCLVLVRLHIYHTDFGTWQSENCTAIRLHSRELPFPLIWLHFHTRDKDSSVVIATRYGLDGPGIETRRGWDFTYPSRPALGRSQSPVRAPALFPGGKAAGAWHWPPNPI
jgi:hypothetical protein